MKELLLAAVAKCEDLEARMRDIQEWFATDRVIQPRKSPAKSDRDIEVLHTLWLASLCLISPIFLDNSHRCGPRR